MGRRPETGGGEDSWITWTAEQGLISSEFGTWASILDNSASYTIHILA